MKSLVLEVMVKQSNLLVVKKVTLARLGENLTLGMTLGEKAIKSSVLEGVAMQPT